MSEKHPTGTVPYEEIAPLPGCGMAFYALLLVFFLLAGITGMVLSTGQLLQASSEAGPTKLRPGSQVGVWQMAPLRDAGVVGVVEIPLAWHDDTVAQDGSRACALMDDRLVQAYDGVGKTLAYGFIDTIDYTGSPEEGSTVTASGTGPDGKPVSIACGFLPHDGGTRMKTQLEVERDRARATEASDTPR